MTDGQDRTSESRDAVRKPPWRTGRRIAGWGVLAVAMILTALSWVIASPVNSSPDDDYHMASMYCPSPHDAPGCAPEYIPVTYPDGTVVDKISVLAPAGAVGDPCYARQEGHSGDCSEAVPDLNAPTRTFRVDNGSYPPLYYNVAHILTGPDLVASTIRIRIMNILLFSGLMIALGLLAPAATRRLMAVVVPIASVPVGVFFIASINPSSWAFTGVLTSWLALQIFLQAADRRTQILTTLVGAIGVTMAVGSRADAAAYVALAAVVVAIIHYRTILAAWWKVLAPLAMCVAGGIGLLSGRQNQIVTSDGSGGGPTGPAGTPYTTGGLFHNLIEFPQLINGMFGDYYRGALGWLDTHPPALTYVGIEIAAGGLILIGLRSLHWSKILAQLLVLAAMVALPVRVLQTHDTVVGYFVQPRYILPLLPLLLGLTLIAADPRRTVGIRRAQAIFFYLLVTAAGTAALYGNLRRYVTGNQVYTFDLNLDKSWWWSSGPTPMATWIVGSLAFAVVTAPMLVTTWNRPVQASEPATAAAPPDEQTAAAAVPAMGRPIDVESDPPGTEPDSAMKDPATEPGTEAIPAAPATRGHTCE